MIIGCLYSIDLPLYTAPKKTWGGHWFPQGAFFVATFDARRQARASKAPTF